MVNIVCLPNKQVFSFSFMHSFFFLFPPYISLQLFFSYSSLTLSGMFLNMFVFFNTALEQFTSKKQCLKGNKTARKTTTKNRQAKGNFFFFHFYFCFVFSDTVRNNRVVLDTVDLFLYTLLQLVTFFQEKKR